MDFTKFVSLISTATLFHARADLLGDDFEGSLPLRNVQERFVPWGGISEDGLKRLSDGIGETRRRQREEYCISCWHENEYESAAMWRLYLKSDEGIAVRSTYRRLKASIVDTRRSYLGKVDYKDYTTDMIDEGNVFPRYLTKRKSFEHEREIRSVINLFGQGDGSAGGVALKVDLETLIDRVYVAPRSPKWFHDVVSNVIAQYGCRFEVVQSDIDQQPIF